MSSGNGDREKARYWQRIIREVARSGMPIREFYRRRRLKESQFYWWQHKLKVGRQERPIRGQGVNQGPASFALVSNEPEGTDAGIELVLGDGRRLRIRKGVDEETLRADGGRANQLHHHLQEAGHRSVCLPARHLRAHQCSSSEPPRPAASRPMEGCVAGG